MLKLMNRWSVLSVLMVMCLSSWALAQPQDGPPGGGPGAADNGGPGGGRGGRGDFRQRMMERMKETLQATDEEWTVIQPRLEAVMQAQMESRVMGMGAMMGGGRGGRRGGDNNGGPGGGFGPGGMNQDSPLAKAVADLRTTLEDANASPATIKAKLEAVRSARKTAQEALTKAQDELKQLLNARQEAELVASGLLE